MIVLEIKPSRLQVAFLAALHLAAVFSFMVGLDLGLVDFMIAAVLAWSLIRSTVASRRGLPMSLGLKEDGGMCLRPHGMAEVDAVVADGASVVLAPVLWVAWREQQGGRRRGVLLLMNDQLAPEDWRRLQVWVRLRTRPVAMGADSESRR